MDDFTIPTPRYLLYQSTANLPKFTAKSKMPAEKRNHFLDIDESDDDDHGSQGYDSDAEQLRKGTSKRRKLNQDDDAEEDEELSANEDLEEDTDDGRKSIPSEGREKPPGREKSTSKDISTRPDVSRPLSKKNLVATEKAVKRSGVVYISRIPPFSKLKVLIVRLHANCGSNSETRHRTVYLRAVRKDQQSLSNPRRTRRCGLEDSSKAKTGRRTSTRGGWSLYRKPTRRRRLNSSMVRRWPR